LPVLEDILGSSQHIHAACDAVVWLITCFVCCLVVREVFVAQDCICHEVGHVVFYMASKLCWCMAGSAQHIMLGMHHGSCHGGHQPLTYAVASCIDPGIVCVHACINYHSTKLCCRCFPIDTHGHAHHHILKEPSHHKFETLHEYWTKHFCQVGPPKPVPGTLLICFRVCIACSNVLCVPALQLFIDQALLARVV
jgi:hypothetical protein